MAGPPNSEDNGSRAPASAKTGSALSESFVPRDAALLLIECGYPTAGRTAWADPLRTSIASVLAGGRHRRLPAPHPNDAVRVWAPRCAGCGSAGTAPTLSIGSHSDVASFPPRHV